MSSSKSYPRQPKDGYGKLRCTIIGAGCVSLAKL